MQVIEIFENIFGTVISFLSPPYFCSFVSNIGTETHAVPVPIRFFCYSFTFSMQEERLVIHAITIVIVMSFAVNIGFHIQRTVLALLLNRIHILGIWIGRRPVGL